MSTFADWYVTHVFPLWPATYGRLTSLVPFSVGEWMLILIVPLILFLLFRKRFRILLWLLCAIALVMTLNCFLCYRTSPIDAAVRSELEGDALQNVSFEAAGGAENLIALRNHAVNVCNAFSEEFAHDENGDLLPEAIPSDNEIREQARESIAALSKAYPQLGGYQVRPKAFLFSSFVSQQYMQGYYFPFSMEANYNDLVVRTNLPFAICHELAHTHGYLREDECNFLAFLACIHSEDPFFQYSGWISVLPYLERDVKKLLSKEDYDMLLPLSELARKDARFLTEAVRAQVEERALFKTETIQKATDVYVDTTLKVNGIPSGKENYSEVVRLLLTYYSAA